MREGVTGRQVALYYPWMVPPRSWLKHALLLHDGTASLVHPDFVDRLQDGAVVAAATHDAADLAWLYGEGLWQPATVSSGVRGSREWRTEVLVSLENFAREPAYRFEGGFVPPLPELTSLYLGKLSHEIDNELLEMRLAKLGRFGGHVMVHEDVASAILAITAKYVAAAGINVDVRLVPATDDAPHHRLATGQLTGPADRYRCIELLLTGLVPVPAESVSFADVVAFRQRHDDEVQAFRAELDALLRRVRTSEDPIDELRSARRDIEVGVRELARAARARRLPLVAGALTATAIGAAALRLPAETVAWTFDGFGVTAAAALLARSVRRPAREAIPYAYLLRVGREFGA